MKKFILIGCLVTAPFLVNGQSKNFWSEASEPAPDNKILNAKTVATSNIYSLDIEGLRNELLKASPRGSQSRNANVVLSFPNANGDLESFRITEASVLPPELLVKYPSINSYAGQGINDPSTTIRFSISDQRGFHGMILSANSALSYIDPYSSDKKVYRVYKRQDIEDDHKDFKCFTEVDNNKKGKSGSSNGRTNDKKLRKYRLALSCNAEYGNLFAGTGTDAQKKANILAQMNITMTRVNGIYERDLAITLQLVTKNDMIIYYGSTSADPWSDEFNTKTQQITDNIIGDANYDIGHNFNTSGGGNAGCIGCVCVSGSKGSAYTGRSDPTGDAFDVDYVAHEMGHQFGGYHTQSNATCISGDGNTEVEPGSGSTIMGYAGICATNVQNNSDPYFHYVNIRDISANIQSGTSSGCAQIVTISNNPPIANAGLDYTIPKSTPFVLKGSGSDPDGDAITFTWEQIDVENANTTSNAAPTSTKTVGPMFRSRTGSSSPNRFMPQLNDVIAGNITPTWEVIPSVGRALNFALTVRDNKAGGGQTSDDVMRVTVNGNSGPFVVTAPNSAVTWSVGSTQTITWNVANTISSPVSCQNVNLLLSVDGGLTYPVTLISNTPNDGTQTITVPNNVAALCRVKVEAVGNIFYDISNVNFTISTSGTCTASVPGQLAVSSITTSTATASWGTVTNASYDIRYRKTGATTWTTAAVTANSANLSNLSTNTEYEVQVRSKCGSTNSAYSTSVNFTTLNTTVTYCSSKGSSVADEYINKVEVGSINNVSGANSGYGNYTSLTTDLVKGNSTQLTITPFWTGSSYDEGYGAWIDYNKDGDFSDSGEQILNKSISKTNPVTFSFTVPGTATLGATRLRISMKYNGVPTACETFSYGEVEDYTVNILETSSGSCYNVTVAIQLDDYPEETSWTIKNASGTVVGSGGPYTSAAKRSTINAVSCLPSGCYTFTINDVYGDGICCSYGNGSYSVKNESNTVLASGSTFTSSKAHSICVGGATKTGRDEIISDEGEELTRSFIYPNPVDQYLNINVGELKMIRSFRISAGNGTLIRMFSKEERTLDVSELPAGLYILSIESDKGYIHEKFIKR